MTNKSSIHTSVHVRAGHWRCSRVLMVAMVDQLAWLSEQLRKGVGIEGCASSLWAAVGWCYVQVLHTGVGIIAQPEK